MASRSSSRRATPAVGPSFRSCKAAASAPPASKLDSKSDELRPPVKGTLAPSYASASSHANAFVPVKPILALKYSKADLMRILKIFLETKGQESKAEIPCERLLKAKIPDVYFGKLHIDCYHFC